MNKLFKIFSTQDSDFQECSGWYEFLLSQYFVCMWHSLHVQSAMERGIYWFRAPCINSHCFWNKPKRCQSHLSCHEVQCKKVFGLREYLKEECLCGSKKTRGLEMFLMFFGTGYLVVLWFTMECGICSAAPAPGGVWICRLYFWGPYFNLYIHT